MKNMDLFIDTNILIDYFSKRQPFFSDADKLFDMLDRKMFNGIIAAHSVLNLAYVLRKQFDQNTLRSILMSICYVFDVIDVDKQKLVSAIQNTSMKDLEDCVQAECAKYVRADYIVSRDLKDFKNSAVPVITPSQAIQQLNPI